MRYVVESVKMQDHWVSKYGKDMRTYAVKFEGVDNWVKLNQLAKTDPPQEGAVMQGELQPRTTPQGKEYFQFKKDFDGGSSATANNQSQLDRIEQKLDQLLSSQGGGQSSSGDVVVGPDEELVDDPFGDL